jgi:outer membrane receptor protein involved in Fe transport
MKSFRLSFVCVATVALLAFAALGATAAPAGAANQAQQGLVNVAIGDISTGDILSNNTVNVAVAANIAATVCGVTIPVAVLAQQVFRTGGFTCEGATQFVEITQRR